MAAIRIAQAAGGVVVFGEEESGEGAVGSVVTKELVDGAKEAWRLRLGKETSLDLLGNFDFLRGAAFGFQPPGEGAALRFDGVGYLIEADQRKGIAVGILEASKDAAPNRSGLCAGRGGVHRLRSAHLHLILEALEAWREVEANSVLGPFAVLGNHIFGDEGDRGRPANELALFRAGLRRD